MDIFHCCYFLSVGQVLWPYILEFLVIPEYTTSINVLCQSISHIAGKKRDEAAIDLEIRFDKLSKLTIQKGKTPKINDIFLASSHFEK